MNECVCCRLLRCVFNVSICFHSEALRNNPTQKAAHSLHYPIDVALKIGFLTTTSHMLEGEWGIKLCNKVQDTAPEFGSFGINFTHDVSLPVLARRRKKRGKAEEREGWGGG